MKCIATRRTPEGLKRRRYALEDGRRYWTIELPETVVLHLGASRMRESLARWQRGEDTRSRRAKLEEMVACGEKNTVVAHTLGISVRRVQKLRREITQS